MMDGAEDAWGRRGESDYKTAHVHVCVCVLKKMRVLVGKKEKGRE